MNSKIIWGGITIKTDLEAKTILCDIDPYTIVTNVTSLYFQALPMTAHAQNVDFGNVMALVFNYETHVYSWVTNFQATPDNTICLLYGNQLHGLDGSDIGRWVFNGISNAGYGVEIKKDEITCCYRTVKDVIEPYISNPLITDGLNFIINFTTPCGVITKEFQKDELLKEDYILKSKVDSWTVGVENLNNGLAPNAQKVTGLVINISTPPLPYIKITV